MYDESKKIENWAVSVDLEGCFPVKIEKLNTRGAAYV